MLRLITLIEKVEKNANVLLTDKQKYDMSRLLKQHNKKEINIVVATQPNGMIVKQVKYGIDDLFDRYWRIKNELNPKDSSSKKSYQLKYGDLVGKKLYNEKLKKCTNTLETFVEKYGEVEGKKTWDLVNKKKSLGIDGFVLRNGEVEGKKRWKEYWKSTGFGTGKRAFQKRFGKNWEIEYNDFWRKNIYTRSLPGQIERYGEIDGKKRYYKSQKQKRKSQSKQSFVQNMIDANFSDIEIQNRIDARWNQTSLNGFIRKYGEIDGNTRYVEFTKVLKENNIVCLEYYQKRGIDDQIAKEIIANIQTERNISIKGKASKESKQVLSPIIQAFNNKSYTYCFDEHEYFIRLNANEQSVSKRIMFFYDLTVPKLNLIIEYHGVAWHDDVDYNLTKTMQLSDFTKLFNLDLFKKWVAEQRGFNVLLIRSWKLKEDTQNMYKFLIENGIDDPCLTVLF